MQSKNPESNFNISQRAILTLLLILIVVSIGVFKTIFFQPAYLLKNFGKLSVDPDIALINDKPTFLEFYAEWCEVCKEMAPKVADLKKEYEREINFVFLNVDNPKWEKYIRKFNVNGIPQLNLFDEDANLEITFIGKQEEKTIEESLDNLHNGFTGNNKILSSEFSTIKENKNYLSSPRSHG